MTTVVIFAALVVVPLVSGLATCAMGDRRPAAGASPALAGTVVTLVASVVAAAREPSATLRWGSGLSLELNVDPLARGPIVLVPVVAIAVVVYATTYGEDRGRSRLLGLLVVFVAAMELLLVAGDFLTLVTAWELVSFVSWALIAHHWRSDAPADAAHAFLVTQAGDLGLFLAAGAALTASGSLSFAGLDELGATGGPAANLFVVGVVVAAFTKSAQVPFSPWLFSAMSGPTPASALLHSATMVAAGAYLLARLHPSLDTVGWFAPVTVGVGVTTALAGGVVAAVQPEAKKLLAASTSAHHGFMLVAVGAGYPAIAIAHLLAHGLFKALLFVSAGVAIDSSGSTRLADMARSRTVRPVAVLVAIGALALAAIPPLGAAWTKDEVVAAASHEAVWVGLLVVVAGGFSAFYATRYQLLAFGPDRRAIPSNAGDATERQHPVAWRRPAVVAMAVLAAGTLAFSVVWLTWGEERLLAVTGGELAPSRWWEFVVSVLAAGIGVGSGVWLWNCKRLVAPGGSVVARRVTGAVADWFAIPAITKMGVVDPVLALSRVAARLDGHVVDAGTRAVRSLGSAVGRAAARRDDDVVDAGVHGAVALVGATSRLLARADDRVVDRGVRATARLATWSARTLDRVAEFGIDGAVDGMARVTGSFGRLSRLTQRGQLHRYYAVIATVSFVLVATLAVWR